MMSGMGTCQECHGVHVKAHLPAEVRGQLCGGYPPLELYMDFGNPHRWPGLHFGWQVSLSTD